MTDKGRNTSNEEHDSDGEQISSDQKKHDSDDEDSQSMRESSLEMYFSRMFSGPLPSPDAFREYEDVLPGAADRILAMAEFQLHQRASAQKMGLWVMFVIAIGFLIGSIALALLAAPAAAVLFPIVPTLVSGGAYVYGLRKRSERPQLPPGGEDDQPKLPPGS